jgi:hypothetical protein
MSFVKGVWQRKHFDGMMKEGDVILKGANAVDLCSQRAAILTDIRGGTIAAALQARPTRSFDPPAWRSGYRPV